MTPSQFYSACRRLAQMPHGDDEIDYIADKAPSEDFRPARAYGEKLCHQGFTLDVATRLFDTSLYRADREGFMAGFNGFKPCVHFVGFRRDSEWWSALAIWGRPDFIHRVWDARVPGDVAPGDTVVFACGVPTTTHLCRSRSMTATWMCRHSRRPKINLVRALTGS